MVNGFSPSAYTWKVPSRGRLKDVCVAYARVTGTSTIRDSTISELTLISRDHGFVAMENGENVVAATVRVGTWNLPGRIREFHYVRLRVVRISPNVTVDDDSAQRAFADRGVGIDAHLIPSRRSAVYTLISKFGRDIPTGVLTVGYSIKKARQSVSGCRAFSFACCCATIFSFRRNSSSVVMQTILDAVRPAARRPPAFTSAGSAALKRRRAPAGTRRLPRAESA